MTNFLAGLIRPAFALAAVALVAAATPAAAQTPLPKVIQGYGDYASTVGLAERPDPAVRYRVIFSVSAAAKDPKDVNRSLEKVARFANILHEAGVHPQPGDLVAVVYGGATPIITNDATYAALTKVAKNPNLDLINKLREAGVTVAVCRQALAGHEIDAKNVAPGVRIDASAITTIAALQLRGYAYIDD